MKKTLLLSLLLLSILGLNTACFSNSNDDLKDVRYTSADSLKCMEVIEKFGSHRDLPTNELVTEIALYFLETPYVAATLEKEPEMLTINLLETDCILFVEMCTSLALTIKSDKPSFEKYCDNVREMRYIDGVVDGYASRNHYTSGWIVQNQENGIMEEITQDLGGDQIDQKFFFMSRNSDKYKQLKDRPELVPAIEMVENGLDTHKYYSLEKEKIDTNKDKIKNGDIVCFVSSVKGLDISHVSFAYHVDDELHFIHASSSEMKVVIEKKSLQNYTKTGIRVVRLN